MGILELLQGVSKGAVKQDDAAKKIAEIGYPESVAKRIASGELPMDEASRMARAKGQGFNTDNRLLHGTDADIKAFDKEMRGSSTDARSANMATWFTDDPLTAGSYANYAAMDSKVKKILDEADKAGNAGDWDKYDSLLRQAEELENSFMDTANRRRGQNIIPVYTKDDLAQVDMGGRSFDDYGTSDEIANRIAIEKSRGRAGVQFNELDDAAGLAYQPATHVAVPDNANIRSVNAAFDPEYKGSNILGFQGGKPDVSGGLMSAISSGAGYMPSDDTDYGEDATSAYADIPEQIWNNMSMLDKAALVTSPIPFVGAGTGILADLANMYNNPEERTGLNAALLAANVIPGAKITDAATGILGAVKDVAKNKPKIDWNGQSKKFTTDVFRNESVSMPKDINKFADKMTDAKAFDDAPTIEVNANDIIPTQKFISKSNMDKLPAPNADTGAELVKVGDKYYVVDGHHRIANNLFAGADSVKAKVIEFK